MAKYRKYSKDFRLQAAKLVTEQGDSYEQAAKQLGTTVLVQRSWISGKFRFVRQMVGRIDIKNFSVIGRDDE